MSLEQEKNKQQACYYHATSDEEVVDDILNSGFRYDSFDEEDGRYLHNGGLLGLGVYVTENWETALWYGGYLFSLCLESGTRIVDSTQNFDSKIIDTLTREFGKEILRSQDFTKVIPQNKKLKRDELLALHRYHYHQTWIRDWGENHDTWPTKRRRSEKALLSTVRVLKRYGYHGYGDSESDVGIVIFAPDRIRVHKLLLNIPGMEHVSLVTREGGTRGITLEELEKKFPPKIHKNSERNSE